LVEQPIRNRQVPGSSPGLGSIHLVSCCRINQFTSLRSKLAENLGTLGNKISATLSTAPLLRFGDRVRVHVESCLKIGMPE
jgi:hypothetical protein